MTDQPNTKAIVASATLAWDWRILGVGSVAIIVGAAVAWSPRVAGLGSICLIAMLALLVVRSRLSKLFLVALAVILLGYAFFGRGFAYLGVAPIYVGEIVLAVGLLAALGGGSLGSIRSPVILLIGLLSIWGAIRTIPFVGIYGLDALRDSVIWAYGAFAIQVSSFVIRAGWLARPAQYYGKWVPWLVLWIPLSAILTDLDPGFLPRVPLSEQALVTFKAGDMAVHLAGLAVFMLLGLPNLLKPTAGFSRNSWSKLWWLAWSVSFLVVASQSRGALLAIVAAMAALTVLRPSRKWVVTVLVGAVILAAATLVDVRFEIRPGRYLAPQQVVTNLIGSFVNTGGDSLDGPREWRLLWWNSIINYTVYGDYFWTGKGFGINLADADGFQVTPDDSLRSPHNGHLTMLARAGVPGFTIWLLLQAGFAVSLLRARARFHASEDRLGATLCVWVIAYWVAFMVNGSFDVFFEGPQGGVWLWSLIGYGTALSLHSSRPQSRGPHKERTAPTSGTRVLVTTE